MGVGLGVFVCDRRRNRGRVGDGVGLGVGLGVGDGVGLDVGGSVGLFVGLGVGDGVGLDVGGSVGEAVGNGVGLTVGEVVGLDVAAFVVDTDGLRSTQLFLFIVGEKPTGQRLHLAAPLSEKVFPWHGKQTAPSGLKVPRKHGLHLLSLTVCPGEHF